MAMLRKIKENIKKISKKKFTAKFAKTKPVKEAAAKENKKEVLGIRETAIEQSKFSHPEMKSESKALPQDLPSQYDKDRMVLLVRDTRWLHTYWEVRGETIGKLKNELSQEFHRSKRLLRVYDVTDIIFNGGNANRFFDIEVNDFANNWYIDIGTPGRSWCVDYGLLLSDGRFVTILRSNTVQTPMEGPSWITDEEWMIPDDMFARLYGMGFGLGRSSPVGKAWSERVRQALFSSGITSMASPVKKIAKERKFWMKVDCELIVYGATEPDAKVTVQEKEIKLRSDGTFTLRFALPDAKLVIPVKAVSADNLEEKTITPIVTRETKNA